MHRPFEILEDWVREGRLRVSDTGEARTDPEPSTPPVPVFESLPEATDREAFEAAMKGVTPLKWNEAPAFRAPRLLDISPRDGEAEILRILEDFCRNGPVGPEQTREYVEHFSDPLGRLYLPDLRSGQFAVQAHLDLHGLTLERARRIVDLFVRESVNAGYSCVRIVHGRGRHSEEGRPLLKENVERWLRHRRMARWVIAYTSARAVDGGGGAVYVPAASSDLFVSRIFVKVFHPFLVDEQIRILVPCKPNDVPIEVLDPAAHLFVVHHFDDNRRSSFR